MRFRKTLIWTLLNKEGQNHPKFTGKKKGEKVFKLFQTLFPGANMRMVGAGEFRDTCVRPLLGKKFPEILDAPAEAISIDEFVQIEPFLPCDGYEWHTDAWRVKFEELLSKM